VSRSFRGHDQHHAVIGGEKRRGVLGACHRTTRPRQGSSSHPGRAASASWSACRLRHGEADFAEKRRAVFGSPGLPDTIEREGLAADTADGVVVSFDDGWVHVRASQTESMIRVIAEAATPARARELADWARDRMGAGR
jgi:hypothetical protein